MTRGRGQRRGTEDVDEDESLDAGQRLPWQHDGVLGGICGGNDEWDISCGIFFFYFFFFTAVKFL